MNLDDTIIHLRRQKLGILLSLASLPQILFRRVKLTCLVLLRTQFLFQVLDFGRDGGLDHGGGDGGSFDGADTVSNPLP